MQRHAVSIRAFLNIHERYTRRTSPSHPTHRVRRVGPRATGFSSVMCIIFSTALDSSVHELYNLRSGV